MDEQQLEQQEEALLRRLERLRQQEEEIRKLEAEQKRREKAKKTGAAALGPLSLAGHCRLGRGGLPFHQRADRISAETGGGTAQKE